MYCNLDFMKKFSCCTIVTGLWSTALRLLTTVMCSDGRFCCHSENWYSVTSSPLYLP